MWDSDTFTSVYPRGPELKEAQREFISCFALEDKPCFLGGNVKVKHLDVTIHPAELRLSKGVEFVPLSYQRGHEVQHDAIWPCCVENTTGNGRLPPGTVLSPTCQMTTSHFKTSLCILLGTRNKTVCQTQHPPFTRS